MSLWARYRLTAKNKSSVHYGYDTVLFAILFPIKIKKEEVFNVLKKLDKLMPINRYNLRIKDGTQPIIAFRDSENKKNSFLIVI